MKTAENTQKFQLRSGDDTFSKICRNISA